MLSGDLFTAEDGTIFNMRNVCFVKPRVKEGYNVYLYSGESIEVSETYYPRNIFITEWSSRTT